MSYSIEQPDAELKGTSAAIRYTVSFKQAAQHLAHIAMEIETTASELVVALPNWLPGSYKIRDFVSFQGDFAASDAKGNRLHFEWIAKNRVRIYNPGGRDVHVSYVYFGNERSVRQSHINRFHAFINPATCLMYVEGRTQEIHHVELEHNWDTVSTALSPVKKNIYGALNYDILVDSPIEIGNHYVATYELHGAEHEIAITGIGDFDRDWITEQTKVIVDTAVKLWKKLPYDRYVFILQLMPGIVTGLEHARSSVNVFDSTALSDKDKVGRLLALLCHEYFHLWNVKRIRAIELGPFDYNVENYTSMLWLAEGLTSYYDDLMTYRCGFVSRQDYLRRLGNDRFAALLEVPGRLSLSLKDSGFLSWVKLYVPTPDSENRAPSYYLKGGVVFALLDMWIIAETDGKHSLDDALLALMDRYHEDPSKGVTEDEFISIVSKATTVDIRSRFADWLNSTSELPYAEIVDKLGLEWRARAQRTTETFGEGREFQKPAPQQWIGIAVEEMKTGLKIAKVVRDSPAEKAGLGADDELLAIDGMRVATTGQWQSMVRGHKGTTPIRFMAASEGLIYEAEVQPVTRDTYELAEKEEKSKKEAARFEAWLHR